MQFIDERSSPAGLRELLNGDYQPFPESGFALSLLHSPTVIPVEYPRWREEGRQDSRAGRCIIAGLRLRRDAERAGCLTERVIDAVEDGLFLANHLYDKALLAVRSGNI